MNKVFEKGLVLMLGGKFWGVSYADGRCTEYGWVDIKKATISNPEYCKKPSDLTYVGSPYIDEMNKGRLVLIERVTSYEVVANK